MAYSELVAPVDLVGDIFKRYAGLFLAASWLTLVPEVRQDWVAPFRQPWAPPGWPAP